MLALPKLRTLPSWFAHNWDSPKVLIPLSLLTIYLLGVAAFSVWYLPGTTINGQSVTLRTARGATSLAMGQARDYELSVQGDGIGLHLGGADIALAVDQDVFYEGARARLASWTWPVALFLPRDYEVSDGVTFNEEQLTAAVEAAVDSVNQDATNPKSASLAYNEEKGTFFIEGEREGTAVNRKRTVERATHSVKTLNPTLELGEEDLRQPNIVASDPRLSTVVDRANTYATSSIDLTVDGNVVKTLDGGVLNPYLIIDDSCNLACDTESLATWARTDLSAEIDTVGTVRTYTRANDGKRIEVYGGGTYGWSMDSATFAKMLCDEIMANSTKPIEIPMKSEGAVYVRGKQDWGPRYLDVDLSEQYVRFFDEDSNIIMESECVSGDISKNDGTVTGVYALENKETDKTLIGLDNNYDGEPDYENEVDYWMPFFGGFGLHDALWRDYFGAEVYTVAGSHGCVNLPYYSAQLLYSLIEVGDPVIVHY